MNFQGARYQILSLMLDYPGEHLQAALPTLAAAVAQWPTGRLKSGLQKGLAQLARQSWLQLQECYTSVFDMDTKATLHLTSHLFQDSEKRAAALAELNQVYQDAGWQVTTAELPDYLPLMLEFMAVCPEACSHDLIRACLGCLEALMARVRPGAPLYADLLGMVDEEIRNGDETAEGRDHVPLRRKALSGMAS